MPDTLLVYGTLRPGKGETVLIPGIMYDLGRFPGVFLRPPGDGPMVVCESIEVDDFDPLDRYEGYSPNDECRSLYIRRPLKVPYGIDAYMYEYNRAVDHRLAIESGDWLEYTKQNRGTYGGRFG